ncbi:MAG: type II secretion system inner membrane protein GspF [Deltaproteobacteria bacterium]|nr:type II secretion system inner membrane protein GspF [Deltaproteobacteria bacterium]
MPIYEYTALNPSGRNTKGSIEADTVRAARVRLRSQGIFPTDIKEASATSSRRSADIKNYFKSNRVSLPQLSVATRQLATLVGAGLPLVSALLALSDQTDSEVLKRMVVDIKEKVEEGSSLANALGNYPRAFPRLYINMVASGEASGTLDAVLENLADYLEAQVELRREITSALFYPILMLFFCTAVVIGLVTLVVPRIVEIFQKQGAVLPLPTRILITISNFLIYYWWFIILLGFLAVYAFKVYRSQPNGRAAIDSLVLRIPIAGSIYSKIITARVSGTLSTLLASGVGLLTALEIVKNMTTNVHISKALEDAREGVREGRSLAKELSKSKLFPNMLCHMIAVGESSGRLEGMLGKAGDAYERDVHAALSGLTSLIEPLMIIVLGGIVFAIVLSILMPMVDLISVVQR